MITPDDITAKAHRLFPKVIKAWLDGEELFPHVLRSSKTLGDDIVANISAVQALREGSKQHVGYGYTVEWVERRLQSSGRNEVPQRILFETRDDLLQLTGKGDEFAAFQTAVTEIRQRLPQLESWLRTHSKQLIAAADAVPDLVAVTEWFRQNPQPNCYARELPLPVHGKFIEQNRTLLRQWFDVEGVLPPHAIRSEESNFYRRYRLRDWEPLITLRCLDAATQQKFRLPCSEAAIPVDYFNSVSLDCVRVFVVENLTNLRTFPKVKSSIVLFGMGNAAVNLRALEQLPQSDVVYWGDLDVFGLRILSQFRQLVSAARSMFMDIQTCREFAYLLQTPRKEYTDVTMPALLTPHEQAAFVECNVTKLQLEQERIPHEAVRKQVAKEALRTM